MDFREFAKDRHLLSLFWNTSPDFYQGNPPLAYIDGRGPEPHALILISGTRTGELISLADDCSCTIRGSENKEKICTLKEIRQDILGRKLFIYDSYQYYHETQARHKKIPLAIPDKYL